MQNGSGTILLQKESRFEVPAKKCFDRYLILLHNRRKQLYNGSGQRKHHRGKIECTVGRTKRWKLMSRVLISGGQMSRRELLELWKKQKQEKEG